MAKYHKGIDALAEALKPLPQPKQLKLRPWQSDLFAALEVEPDDRHIMWIWDKDGNKGKTTFLRWYISNYPSDSILMDGRVTDMAHAYDSQRVVFFDIARTQAENVDHLCQFAEKLKNGMYLSSKYDSKMKVFQPPHVVFFANIPCPHSKWSADRPVVIELE